MIVVDASAILEALLATKFGKTVLAHMQQHMGGIFAPHVIDLEVTSALRRYVLQKDLHGDQAFGLMNDYQCIDIKRVAHEAYLDRIWSLRENFTPYDAAYLAIAEAFDSTIITADKKFARAGAKFVSVLAP